MDEPKNLEEAKAVLLTVQKNVSDYIRSLMNCEATLHTLFEDPENVNHEAVAAVLEEIKLIEMKRRDLRFDQITAWWWIKRHSKLMK